MTLRHAIIILLCFGAWAAEATARGSLTATDSLVLNRIFNYKATVDVLLADTSAYVYTRYDLGVQRRNFLLLFVPSLYAIAKGQREYAGEVYTRLDVGDNTVKSSVNAIHTSTVPHNRMAMRPVAEYLIPHIYDETMTGSNHTLSPFNRINARYYRYTVTPLVGGMADVLFVPRVANTQLLYGKAVVDAATGRVISTAFYGEYDMIRMKFRLEMGDEGAASLFAKTVSVDSRFSFLGNKIDGSYFTYYGAESTLPDTVVNSHDRALMDSIRPVPLPQRNTEAYARYDSLQTVDSLHHESKWKTILWDVIGDNLVNRISSKFGAHDQGYFRLSPLLNPLYLDYSHNRGLSYRMKIRARYNFSVNSSIELYIKGGYSFKLHHFYYRNTLRYTFNRRHGGYIEMEGKNGTRQTSSEITDIIKSMKSSDIRWGELGVEYFKHSSLKLTINYDLTDRWSVQPAMVYHHHTAEHRRQLIAVGQPGEYKTLAPSLKIQFRPSGWHGMAITADYERGLKDTEHNGTGYERIEGDWAWKIPLSAVRALSLRAGGGFYTSRSSNCYFVNYDNFQENNLSDGWNDDWSGDFQLLNSHWYNVSEYYFRANATYESPLMIMSHLPWVGKYMETERLYVNVLWVTKLHPYIEYGYGFTNRLFSMGFFAATRNTTFDGVGIRMALELFSGW